MRKHEPLKDRIKRRSHVDENGCWTWRSKPNSWGYANLDVRMPDGSVWHTVAHRASYYAFVGPIPSHLVLDHLCRNTMCVNPDHLQPVTDRVNVLRSPITLATINLAKTHCPHGHPYSDENTGRTVNPGGRRTVWRWCRTCRREASRRASNRRRNTTRTAS